MPKRKGEREKKKKWRNTHNISIIMMKRILLSTFIPYHLISHPRAKYLMFSFLCLFREKKCVFLLVAYSLSFWLAFHYSILFACSRSLLLFCGIYIYTCWIWSILSLLVLLFSFFTFVTFKTFTPIIINTVILFQSDGFDWLSPFSVWYVIQRNIDAKYPNRKKYLSQNKITARHFSIKKKKEKRKIAATFRNVIRLCHSKATNTHYDCITSSS